MEIKKIFASENLLLKIIKGFLLHFSFFFQVIFSYFFACFEEFGFLVKKISYFVLSLIKKWKKREKQLGRHRNIRRITFAFPLI